MERLQRFQPDRRDGAGAGELLRPHDVAELFRQLGHLGEILGGLARAVPAEAFEPFDHVSRIADFAHLTVADDRHAGGDLFRHCLADRRLDRAIELGFVVSLAVIAREQQRHELGPARKAADMGGCDHAKLLRT